MEPTLEDANTSSYFLGHRSVTRTNDATVDLGMIVRDIDELIIINDEAHHIHDEDMAWSKSILDIDNRLKQKGGGLSLQLDLTATPKKKDGSIFVQTITDYPLVEAIHQRIVKNPVVPDAASRGKLKENQSALFSERFRDYINLGIEEWRKTYKTLEPMGKKSILFIMTDDTKNCDEVAEYIKTGFVDLRDAVLTIHTNKSGEISESVSGKNKEDLDILRKQANEIDSWESPFKVIVSVMMLKEGWDVKNVTTIVGLRPYAADSKILPEQTLGRGLRRMFFGRNDVEEYVSVVGTVAFLDFVESIKGEGVILEKKAMGAGSKPIAPTVIEVDRENPHKNIEKLDIEVPVMTPRIQREYKNLSQLNVSSFGNPKMKVKIFSEEEKREIVFKDVVDEKTHHTTILTGDVELDYRSVIGFFSQAVMRELRLFGCYDILFGKIKEFIQDHLFDTPVDLTDLNVLRNLSEVEYIKVIKDSFKKAINELTVQDKGDTEIKNYIKLSDAKPFVVNDKAYLLPKKSVFNKIVGDSDFELTFANFIENCEDVISFAKNFQNKEASVLRIEYKNSEGFIATYYPDFFVNTDDKTVYIVETKGREEEDDKLKFERLKKWCKDVNFRQSKMVYKALYIKQEEWEKYKTKSFDEVIRLFS
jgi:type III restriction enzyme